MLNQRGWIGRLTELACSGCSCGELTSHHRRAERRSAFAHGKHVITLQNMLVGARPSKLPPGYPLRHSSFKNYRRRPSFPIQALERITTVV